ncbi:MAG: hypothetical protein U1C74_21600 [Phenylobacterium sp.]|nr:hypothetical protein [Phenylobacterium sp.]
MSDDDGLDGYETVAVDPLPEAGEEADSRAQPFVDPPMEQCPVVPLGFEAGKVVFAMPEGEIRKEPAAKVGAMLRTDIFACEAGQTFLTYWRDPENKFLRDLATVWFVRKCRRAGLWDSARQVRGLGVWPGADGELVLHLGDEVWRCEERRKPEVVTIVQALRAGGRGPLYRLRPPAPRPRKAASAGDGAWVRETLDLWKFEPIGTEGLTGADVVAGWTMAGMLGAAAPFRGHLLGNALAGSGKSTLMRFVHALQSAVAGEIIDAFSEAGLRNDLAGMARPVLLDEAESSSGPHGPGVVERALELLRRMSTGSGGHRVMGDIGGGSISQTAVGAVFMAAINPPRLGPADATRIVEVRLLPLSGPGADGRRVAPQSELDAAIGRARDLAPAFFGRAIKGSWRYRADVETLKAAVVRAGESPRTADLIAMLAAGRRLLLADEPLTDDMADDEVAFWRPLLTQREAAETVSNPGADALAHLMAADTGVHVSNRRESLGGLVARWAKDREDYHDVLKAHGVRIWEGQGPDGREGPWLFVANHHPRLEAIYRGTPWADWRRALANLDAMGPQHATWPTKPQNFGVGVKQRSLAIPLTPWLEIKPGDHVWRPEPGPVPGGRSSAVPPTVPEEDLDWPE